MPRKIIPLENGEAYHVYNRGVDKRDIFLDQIDLSRFYKYLGILNRVEPIESLFRFNLNKNQNTTMAKKLVDIHAYCLLPNHFHLLLTQKETGGISEFMKRLGGGYASFFNERYERSGSLFQGTFKRVHITTNEQFLYVSSYINCNRLVHGLDGQVLHKSSLSAFEGKHDPVIDIDMILSQVSKPGSYVSDAKKLARQIYIKRKSNTLTPLDQEVLLEK